jgi:hypothetical protein
VGFDLDLKLLIGSAIEIDECWRLTPQSNSDQSDCAAERAAVICVATRLLKQHVYIVFQYAIL